jgi:phosphate starvation-inducible PhoH-like protein
MPKKIRNQHVDSSNVQLQHKLSYKTDGHKEYIRTMVENDITVCVGPPGSGKSFTSVGYACELLSRQEIDKIVFSRPIVGCGKGIAALPGDVTEKVTPYFIPILDCLDYFLGEKQTKFLMANKTIEFTPLELMRGMSIKDTFLVLDEASNAEYTQLKMLLSRLDNGSKFVLNGDYKQCDLRRCDFEEVVYKLSNSKIRGLGFCELTESDVQRPKFINSIMRCLEN